MKRKYSVCFLLLFLVLPITSKAQILMDTDAFSIGKEDYAHLRFNDRFSIEQWEDGFNIWIPWPYRNHGNYKLFVDKTTKVGIGRKPNTYKLEVGGSMWVEGNILQTSDVRLKNNIQNLSERNCLELLNNLSGKVYQKKSSLGFDPNEEVKLMVKYGKIAEDESDLYLKEIKEQEKRSFEFTEFGFIAQELKDFFPELVNEDKQGYLSVDYLGLIPVLVESIKELKKIVDEQNKEFDNVFSSYSIENQNKM